MRSTMSAAAESTPKAAPVRTFSSITPPAAPPHLIALRKPSSTRGTIQPRTPFVFLEKYSMQNGQIQAMMGAFHRPLDRVKQIPPSNRISQVKYRFSDFISLLSSFQLMQVEPRIHAYSYESFGRLTGNWRGRSRPVQFIQRKLFYKHSRYRCFHGKAGWHDLPDG